MRQQSDNKTIIFLTEHEAMGLDSTLFVFKLANAMSAVGYRTAVLNLGKGLPRPQWLVPPYASLPSVQSLRAVLARTSRRIHIPVSWRLAYVCAEERADSGSPFWYLAEDVWLAGVHDNAEARLALRSFRLGSVLTRSSVAASVLGSIGIPEVSVLPSALERSLLRVGEMGSDSTTVLMHSDPDFPEADAQAAKGFRIAKASRRDLALAGFGYADRPKCVAVGSYTQLNWHDDGAHARREAFARALCFVWTGSGGPAALPVLEAMAMGCPVVAVRNAGGEPLCADGENCLLVDRNDSQALADAVLRLAGDETLRARLVAGGRRIILDCTWERLLDALPEGIRREQRQEGSRGLEATAWE